MPGGDRKGKKIRTEFRKGHDTRQRKTDFTRDYHDVESETQFDQLDTRERVSGKGDLTRKRTIVGHETSSDETGFDVHRQLSTDCVAGRVLSVHGLSCKVEDPSGIERRCSVRGVLKSLSTDLRHVVVAGDRVTIRMSGDGEGVIERIEPRHGVISRTSRGRQHVIAANVDGLLIVASAAEPEIKPNLIDRMLVTAEKSGVEPLICVNKIDLIDPSTLQPLLGVYGQLGYKILLVSARQGIGIQRLASWVKGRDVVVAGQSGVGKSSLLNAIEPGLNLRVGDVSQENQKGKHTTTAARLIPLKMGGHLVDTPGIRSFSMWDLVPAEVASWYRDVRPFVNRCRFPDCTHSHEEKCGVKDAVADNLLDLRRYESLLHLQLGEEA